MLSQFDKTAKRLKQIHSLIKTRATGNRKVLAEKIGLSESHLSEYLRYIRDQGIEIAYDYNNDCYFYPEGQSFKFSCGFEKEIT